MSGLQATLQINQIWGEGSWNLQSVACLVWSTGDNLSFWLASEVGVGEAVLGWASNL